MKKFNEEEWLAFQKRVEKVGSYERTVRANLFLLVFDVWKHYDSSITIEKVGYGWFK